jgi:hypothetical protein
VVDDNAACENGLDIQKLCDYTGTVSRATKKAINKVYEWTGIWGPLTSGFGGGFIYFCLAKGPDWLKEVIGGCAVVTLGKMVDRIEKNARKYMKEKARLEEYKNEYASSIKAIKSEYEGMMKGWMTNELFDLDEKINVKYEDLLVDKFTKELCQKMRVMDRKKAKPGDYNIEQLAELRENLERMKTCIERKTDKKREMGNHGSGILGDTNGEKNGYDECGLEMMAV